MILWAAPQLFWSRHCKAITQLLDHFQCLKHETQGDYTAPCSWTHLLFLEHQSMFSSWNAERATCWAMQQSKHPYSVLRRKRREALLGTPLSFFPATVARRMSWASGILKGFHLLFSASGVLRHGDDQSSHQMDESDERWMKHWAKQFLRLMRRSSFDDKEPSHQALAVLLLELVLNLICGPNSPPVRAVRGGESWVVMRTVANFRPCLHWRGFVHVSQQAFQAFLYFAVNEWAMFCSTMGLAAAHTSRQAELGFSSCFQLPPSAWPFESGASSVCTLVIVPTMTSWARSVSSLCKRRAVLLHQAAQTFPNISITLPGLFGQLQLGEQGNTLLRILLKEPLKKKTREKSRVNNLATFLGKILANNVAKSLTLPWPSYWPYFLIKKPKINISKSSKKTIFIVFLSSKAKNNKTAKKSNNFGTCNHNLCCKKYPEVLPLFGGCFFGFFFGYT